MVFERLVNVPDHPAIGIHDELAIATTEVVDYLFEVRPRAVSAPAVANLRLDKATSAHTHALAFLRESQLRVEGD